MNLASLLLCIQLALPASTDSAVVTGSTGVDTVALISAPALADTVGASAADSAVAGVDSAVVTGAPAPPADTLPPATGALPVAASSDSAARAMSAEFRPDPFDMITNLPGDWMTWGKNTFAVDNLPWIGGMAALTTGLVITDYETWQPFKKIYESNNTVRQLSDMAVGIGDGKFQFGLALLFGAYGFIADDSRALRTASQTVEVILACGAVVQFLKHTTGRESPFCATTPTGRWALFPNQIEYAKHVPHYDAFPSGHIATALATLTVIADNYDDQKWIRYIGYPVIGAVGIGLVATSIHWWSDIPLGLALGYSFGRIVSGHGRPDAGMARLGTGSVPDLGVTLFSDGTPGIQASWRW